MKTTTSTIRIRLDQAVEVEDRNMNLSEFVRQKLDEEFGSNDFIKAKEKELTEQLKKLKQIKKESKIIKKTKGEEKSWLQESKKRVEASPGEISENRRVYNQKFGKRVNLTTFKELIADGE